MLLSLSAVKLRASRRPFKNSLKSDHDDNNVEYTGDWRRGSLKLFLLTCIPPETHSPTSRDHDAQVCAGFLRPVAAVRRTTYNFQPRHDDDDDGGVRVRASV